MYNLIISNIPKFLKNFLIFFPILISKNSIDNQIILDLIFGFLIFCSITFIIYITNDFIDHKKDQINILKKNKNKSFFSKSQIIYLNLCFLPILFLSVKLDLFSSYLILYIFSFYIYTFKTKFIKFLDLIFLNSFYIFRLLYGCDLVGIEISYWFIIFFSTLFFILSIFKRIIQIKINNLKKINKIISYSYKDISLLKKFIFNLIFINSLTFLFYIFQSEIFYLQILSSNSTYINFDKTSYMIIFFIYLLNLIILTKKVFKENIKKDIFNFVINDRLIILCLALIFFILIIR